MNRATALLLCVMALCSSAFAGVQYASYYIPPADRDLAMMKYGNDENTTFSPNTRIEIPGFTGPGTLVDVEILFNIQPTWDYRAENPLTDPTGPISWIRRFNMNVVYRPGFEGAVEFNQRNTVGNFGESFGAGVPNGYQAAFPPRTPFDGSLDFDGPSGLSVSYLMGYMPNVVTTHINQPGPELNFWKSSNLKVFYISPRMLTTTFTTTGFPGHWISESDIRAHLGSSVTVVYHYQ